MDELIALVTADTRRARAALAQSNDQLAVLHVRSKTLLHTLNDLIPKAKRSVRELRGEKFNTLAGARFSVAQHAAISEEAQLFAQTGQLKTGVPTDGEIEAIGQVLRYQMARVSHADFLFFASLLFAPYSFVYASVFGQGGEECDANVQRGGKGVVSLFDVAVSLPPSATRSPCSRPSSPRPFPPLHSAQLDSLLPPWAAALEDLAGAEQRAADARHARDRRTTPSSPSRPQRSPTAAEVRAAAEQRAMGALFDTQPFVSVLLCTVTFYANLAYNLTRSP
jgi:hypothetical protein